MTLQQRIEALATGIGNYLRDTILPRVLPAGGGAGLVLAKTGAGDYAVGWAAAGGATLSGQSTITIPNGAGQLEWTEQVAAAGVLAINTLLCHLAPGADANENTADMIDLVTLSAVAALDTITFTITLSTPLSGPVLINWKVI